MTIPTPTQGALTRVRTWIAALLACTAVGVTAVDAQAAPPPDPPRTYEVTADLDGRLGPFTRRSAIASVGFLQKRQRVSIECQEYGDRAYGSKLWDLVTSDRKTLFVPDRFIKTGTSGRAPGIRRCDGQDVVDPSPL
jgi:hypothetical protein